MGGQLKNNTELSYQLYQLGKIILLIEYLNCFFLASCLVLLTLNYSDVDLVKL